MIQAADFLKWLEIFHVPSGVNPEGVLYAANNLDDLDNLATARSNLGVGSRTNSFQLSQDTTLLNPLGNEIIIITIKATVANINVTLPTMSINDPFSADSGTAYFINATSDSLNFNLKYPDGTALVSFVAGQYVALSLPARNTSVNGFLALTYNSAVNLLLAGGSMTGNLFLNADPTVYNQAATKNYVDNTFASISAGISERAQCKVSTTTNIVGTYANGTLGVGATITTTATGLQSYDGYTPSLNDRILVQFQTAPEQNGIYTVTTLGTGLLQQVLTRATDYNSNANIESGAWTNIANGTLYAGGNFIEVGLGPFTVGTTPIIFGPFGIISAGVGLAQSGTQIYLANTAVTAGSYGGVTQSLQATVNAQGQLTAITAASIQIAESQVTNLVSDLAGKQPLNTNLTSLAAISGAALGLTYQSAANTFLTGNLSGDITSSGLVTTLATVNSNVGTFGSATNVGQITASAKGLVTALTNVPIAIPHTQITDFNSAISDKGSCDIVTTTNLTATYNNGTAGVGATLTATTNGAFQYGNYSGLVNRYFLINGQTTHSQNGIYQLTQSGGISTPWILTRPNFYDGSVNGLIKRGDQVFVEWQDTTDLALGNYYWQTSNVTTVGTDAISFTANLQTDNVTINFNTSGQLQALTCLTTPALTGDITSTGLTNATTLATVNSNVGSFGTASNVMQATVNGKGLVTAAANVAIQIAESQVTNLVSDLAGKQTLNANLTSLASISGAALGIVYQSAANTFLTGALTGDITTSALVSTLATVNSNVGSFGSVTNTLQITANAKGLVTALSSSAIAIPHTQMTDFYSSITVKPPVLIVTTTNLNASYNNGSSGVGATLTNQGTQVAFVYNGYTATLNDVILIASQIDPAQNGIYQVTNIGSGATNWVLTRVPYYDGSTNGVIQKGDQIFVEFSDSVNMSRPNYYWQYILNVVVGTTAIGFAPMSQVNGSTILYNAAGQVTTNSNLTALGNLNSTTGILCETAANTFVQRTLTSPSSTITVTNPGGVAGNIGVDIGNLSGDVTSSGLVTTLASIVTAGTNPKITYNAKGQVTAGAPLAAGDIPSGLTLSAAVSLTFTGSNQTALSSYEETTATFTLATGFTTTPTFTGKLKRIGNLAHLTVPNITATTSGTPANFTVTGLPARFTPAILQNGVIGTQLTGSTFAMTVAQIATNGILTVFPNLTYSGTFASAVTAGLETSTFTYALT